MFPSVVHMGMSHETSLSCGMPSGRPPDSDLMKYVSYIDASFIDPREEGALEDHSTSLRVWGRYKERESIFPLTSLSILTSQIALRRYATRRKSDNIMNHGILESKDKLA